MWLDMVVGGVCNPSPGKVETVESVIVQGQPQQYIEFLYSLDYIKLSPTKQERGKEKGWNILGIKSDKGNTRKGNY